MVAPDAHEDVVPADEQPYSASPDDVPSYAQTVPSIWSTCGSATNIHGTWSGAAAQEGELGYVLFHRRGVAAGVASGEQPAREETHRRPGVVERELCAGLLTAQRPPHRS